MAPTNYDMAIECIRSAEVTSARGGDLTEAMAAQTYATLAFVDEIRDMRSFVAEYLAAAEDVMSTGIKEVVADEVSSALLEAFTRRDGHAKGLPV